MSVYRLKMDLRANDGKVISIEDGGGHVNVSVEDGDVEMEIKFSYEQWNGLTNSIDEQWGLKTYSNICDK